MRLLPLFAVLLVYILKAQYATSRAVSLETRGALQGYGPSSVMQRRDEDEYVESNKRDEDEYVESNKRDEDEYVESNRRDEDEYVESELNKRSKYLDSVKRDKYIDSDKRDDPDW